MSEVLHDENLNKPANNAATEDEGKVEILPPTFDRETRTFISHVISLSVTLDISISAIKEALKKTNQQYEEFSKEHMSEVEKD